MDVGDELALLLGEEGLKVPVQRSLDRAVDVEPPALARDPGREPEIEHGPVPSQVLARRQPLILGPRHVAGEELAFAGPALLAAGELALGGNLVLVGHFNTSFVPMHGRSMLGVAHRRIDDQRQEDDA
jgi:hypothetical protein